MDPITAKVILRVGELALESIKEDELTRNLKAIQSKLDIIIQKSDQLILREVLSAYEALGDAISTGNKKTREIRLRFVENNLLKNTNLDSSLVTGGFKNSYLIALSHYGLAFVCILRDDLPIASRHLVRAFAADPQASRTELLPTVYEQIFKPKCSDVFEWHKKTLDEIENDDFTLNVVAGKLTAVAMLIGGGAAVFAAAAVPQLKGVAQAGTRVIGRGVQEKWNASDAHNFRIQAKHNLAAELEQRLDGKCREIASSLLSE